MNNKTHKLYYGWIIVAVLFLTFPLLSAWIFSANSVISARMFKEMGWTPTLSAYGTAGVALMQAVFGPLLGREAKKRGSTRRMLILAGIVEIIGFFLLYNCSSYGMYMICYVLIVGTGLGLASGLSHQLTLDPWFHQAKANAIAIMLCSGGLFGFFSSNFFNAVAERVGWRMSWLVVAAFCLLGILLVVIFVKNGPADVGEVPDGRNYKPKAKMVIEDPNKGAPAEWCLKQPKFYALTVNYSIKNGMYYVVIALLVLRLLDGGFTNAQAAFVLSMYSMVSCVGRIMIGVLPEKILTPYRIALSSSIFYVIGMFGMVITPSYPMAVVYAGIMGMGMGTSFASYPVLISRYFGSDNFPTLSGRCQIWIYVCSAAAPTLVTMLYTALGNYSTTFAVVGIINILITIPLFFAAKPPLYKKTAAEASAK